MKTRILIAAVLASAATAFAIPAHADGWSPNHFADMADKNKDGMVTKAEAMKMFEAMFDKADKQKKGMLDKKQVETLFKMLMDPSFGG